MGRFCLRSIAAVVCVLGVALANRPSDALTSAEALDSANVYSNVGVIMVWRDANNPLGLPGGLATSVTGVLIHPQVILTAGHFTARIEGVSAGGQLPPWNRLVASFAPSAFDESTWVELNRGLGTCVTHPSFPKPCTPQSCPFNDIDGQHEPGVSDVGLCFLDEPVLGIRPAKLGNRRLDHTDIPGTRMTIVGYGTTTPPPGGPADTSNYDGLRRWGSSTLDQVVDSDWVTFNRDPVTVCFGDSGAPTFFKGRVVAIASDGAADCTSADVRARVDNQEVRSWIRSRIVERFGEAALSSPLDFAEPEPELDGKKLFEKETFGGNGRTCRTCHSKDTGTLSLADVQRLIDQPNPNDRFVLHDALDADGVGTTRVRTHATVAYTIPLPPWVSMADAPGARHVTVFRGIPSTLNTPALDPVLMHDGRVPTLQDQARDAIRDHYQTTVEPTAAQLDALAGFQRTDPKFFSSEALRRFAAGGPPPELPAGRTAAEQRGREFLVDAPFAPPSKKGICALCHGGPMLNRVNQAHSDFVGGSPPPGVRFFNTGVTLVNQPKNPIRKWIINDGINPEVTIESPDIGLLLNPAPPTPPPSIIPRAFFAGLFKIPTLWGVKDTAPYFHNNGARTLRDAVAHYQRFFNFTEAQDPVGSRSLGGLIELTDSDVDDIVAYLELLGPNRKQR